MKRVYTLIWLLTPIVAAAAILGHRNGLLILGLFALVAGLAGFAPDYRASTTVRS